jgi:hypothetical protein
VNRALFALVAFFVIGSALGQSPEPAQIRITTWNLEWFPNGSPHNATQEKQSQRIEAAADVLKKLNPDVLLLQEMRDYTGVIKRTQRLLARAFSLPSAGNFAGTNRE